MATSGFEPTYVRGQDPFADLSVESTLIDPKYALPADIQQLASKLAEAESAASASVPGSTTLPPGAVTRVKVRVNRLGSGGETQIGEMLPEEMAVLMTHHLPTSFDLDDIAGDELGDARDDFKSAKPMRSVHEAPMTPRVYEPEVSEPIVRAVRDPAAADEFPTEDEPATVNAYVEHVIAGGRTKPPKAMDTAPMRAKKSAYAESLREDANEPISNKAVAPVLDAFDTADADLGAELVADLDAGFDPDKTLPPASKRRALAQASIPTAGARPAAERAAPRERLSGFASRKSFPVDEVTKTSYGQDLDEELASVIREELGESLGDNFADAFNDTNDAHHDSLDAFGEAPPSLGEGSFDDVAGLGGASGDDEPPADRQSFSQILERVRVPKRPRHDVAPQRYIQTKITSNPKIGITPENTSIVNSDREEQLDRSSGFADGKPYQIDQRELSALTKPPRRLTPYFIACMGVIGAIAALYHAISAPL